LRKFGRLQRAANEKTRHEEEAKAHECRVMNREWESRWKAVVLWNKTPNGFGGR
jgi:hypothetical protein